MSAPGRTLEHVTSSNARESCRRLWVSLTVLTIAALAVLPGPIRSTNPRPAQAAAATSTTDDFAEVRDLHRAARAARVEPAPQAIPTPPAAAPTERAHVSAPAPHRVATRPARRVPLTAASVAPTPGGAGRAAVVVAFALAQVGKRYVWATAGPGTFDCSGLVMAAFARVGVGLPHQSGGIAGRGRFVPHGQWAPGDVLIYPGHVAIYIGAGRMVHAANPRKGVLVAAVYGSPTARRLV